MNAEDFIQQNEQPAPAENFAEPENDEKLIDSEVKNPGVEASEAEIPEAETAGVETHETETSGAKDSEVAELSAEIAELTSDLQRTRADFENYRKNVESQRAHAAAAASESTVSKILPLLDDFDHAFATYKELKPLEKSLEKTLKSLNLKKIDSKKGTVFDPELHNAISVEDGSGSKEIVVETLRPGYYYGDSVLRPAMVRVGYE